MKLINATPMQAGYTMGMRPDGRELLVVAVKGTFTIPQIKEEPQLAQEQAPLVEADVFTGEPGLSAMMYESDYAPYKPRCDILLNGTAYAPGAKPVMKLPVSLKMGPIVKSFNVVGDRVWKWEQKTLISTSPHPFLKMPISYSVAFGGVDNYDKDPSNHGAYSDNPVGVGFHCQLKPELVVGKPLPNTEEIYNPVSRPDGQYKPMAFGPLSRHFQCRIKLAGTYDQNWIDNTFPFLPPDFSEAYYQSAPEDQQIPYPTGGEEVTLSNLTPEGNAHFRLPIIKMPIEFSTKKWGRHEKEAVIDTIVIEPDKNRFMLTWRSSLLLHKNIFEVIQIVVGKMSPGWYRARETGKNYFDTRPKSR